MDAAASGGALSATAGAASAGSATGGALSLAAGAATGLTGTGGAARLTGGAGGATGGAVVVQPGTGGSTDGALSLNDARGTTRIQVTSGGGVTLNSASLSDITLSSGNGVSITAASTLGLYGSLAVSSATASSVNSGVIYIPDGTTVFVVTSAVSSTFSLAYGASGSGTAVNGQLLIIRNNSPYNGTAPLAVKAASGAVYISIGGSWVLFMTA